MDLFDQIKESGHEQLVFCSDPKSGLRALIAIHSTKLGPSLGGCRMWPYETFDQALSDALRLSKAMTYKAAISDLPLGGGKSVIWGDANTDKTRPLLDAFAHYIEGLSGRYIVAEDVGISVSDIEIIRETTAHVAGFNLQDGSSGDPSPATAYGVFQGMRACLENAFGHDNFSGLRIAIQGLGKVGSALAKRLHEAGAHLIVSDVDPERVANAVRDYGADPIHGHEIYRVDCDIFAPCALGSIVNPRSIESLSCRIIAGAANNQLSDLDMGAELEKRDILYAPDYVLNAGGLINIAEELQGYDKNKAYDKILKIHDRLKKVFSFAKEKGISTALAAEQMAKIKLKAGKP